MILEYIEAAKAAALNHECIVLKKVGFTGRDDKYALNTHVNPQINHPKIYTQIYQEEKGFCVWLSMCLIVNLKFPELAKDMYSKMRELPYIFQWLTVKGQSIFYDGKKLGMSKQDLKELLYGEPKPIQSKIFAQISGVYLFSAFFYPNQYNISFKYVKSRRKNKKLFVLEDFLKEKDGYYVAFLAHSVGFSSHAIGIDCKKKMIYDPDSKYVMQLNEDALNECMGNEYFDHFSAVYELFNVPHPPQCIKKKSRKRNI